MEREVHPAIEAYWHSWDVAIQEGTWKKNWERTDDERRKALSDKMSDPLLDDWVNHLARLSSKRQYIYGEVSTSTHVDEVEVRDRGFRHIAVTCVDTSEIVVADRDGDPVSSPYATPREYRVESVHRSDGTWVPVKHTQLGECEAFSPSPSPEESAD